MEERDNVPPEVLCGPGRKGGVEILSHREERADDIVGLQFVGFDQRPQQLVRGRENLVRIIPVNGGSSPDPMEANGWRHGR